MNASPVNLQFGVHNQQSRSEIVHLESFTNWAPKDASLEIACCPIPCVGVDTMATNLLIDPDLLEKALAIGGEKTKKATVNEIRL